MRSKFTVDVASKVARASAAPAEFSLRAGARELRSFWQTPGGFNL